MTRIKSIAASDGEPESLKKPGLGRFFFRIIEVDGIQYLASSKGGIIKHQPLPPSDKESFSFPEAFLIYHHLQSAKALQDPNHHRFTIVNQHYEEILSQLSTKYPELKS